MGVRFEGDENTAFLFNFEHVCALSIFEIQLYFECISLLAPAPDDIWQRASVFFFFGTARTVLIKKTVDFWEYGNEFDEMKKNI